MNFRLLRKDNIEKVLSIKMENCTYRTFEEFLANLTKTLLCFILFNGFDTRKNIYVRQSGIQQKVNSFCKLNQRFLLIILFCFISSACEAQKQHVLVFSKTEGYKHESIEAGNKMFLTAGKENGFNVDTTKDATDFNFDNLKKYQAVVFLNTTGNVLNDQQQLAFEQYIREGGGFVGIHSAADTEYDWPWYGNLVGGYFKSHVHVVKATIEVINRNHISTEHLPARWERSDEWYDYKSFYPGIEVLAKLDENSYKGGQNGDYHPISWFHYYDGGRAFYTGGGHTSESFSTDPYFMKHVIQGVLWAAGIEN